MTTGAKARTDSGDLRGPFGKLRAGSEESVSQPFFRPSGARSFPASDLRLTPWAVLHPSQRKSCCLGAPTTRANPGHPTESDEGLGVLRLRMACAARRSCAAQDDKGSRNLGTSDALLLAVALAGVLLGGRMADCKCDFVLVGVCLLGIDDYVVAVLYLGVQHFCG